MKQIHEFMRELREQQGYTQEYIAKYLGITQQTYSNYELGIREVPLHHIVRLSHFYQVSTDYLLGIKNPYARNINLSQEYFDGISLHDFIYNIQQFDTEKRKSLAQFVRFLNSQE